MALKYVPKEMLVHVHQDSGYLDRGCQYANKSVYGLFMDYSNILLITQLMNIKLQPHTILTPKDVHQMMVGYKKIKTGEVDADSIISNPIVELSFRNHEFIDETTKNILIRLIPLSAEHEHQQRLLEYQNIDESSIFRESDWGTPNAFLGDAKQKDARNVYRWGNRIPPDRVSAQHRHYERDITDSLRDTRQLEQPISGYDMSGLTKHSSNNNFPCGEYDKD